MRGSQAILHPALPLSAIELLSAAISIDGQAGTTSTPSRQAIPKAKKLAIPINPLHCSCLHDARAQKQPRSPADLIELLLHADRCQIGVVTMENAHAGLWRDPELSSACETSSASVQINFKQR